MGDAGLTDPVCVVVDEDRKTADHVPDRLKAIEDVLFSDVSDIYTNDVHTASIETAGGKQSFLHRANDEDEFPFTGHNDGEKQRATQIILIPQVYSWGRLKVTSLLFSEIMRRWQVCPGFLDIVGAYGVKTNEDERVFYGWRESGGKDELCYNVPHVERHGRELRDPWSSRQMALYHQHSSDAEPSRWIMLNVSTSTRTKLDRFLASEDTQCCNLALHARLLDSLGQNWTAYIEDLTVALLEQDNKASYCSIDKSRENHGFTVTYHDLQEMHMLQAKIDRASVAVEACVEIGRKCLTHFERVDELTPACSASRQSCRAKIGVYVSDMARHSQALQRLDRRLKGILDLVDVSRAPQMSPAVVLTYRQISRVLMFRNEVLLQNFNRHSGDTLDALLAINQQSRIHQATLTQLFATVQADSVLLKILGIVATVYLPASLVATVFSSNLIQYVAAASPTAEPQRLVLSPQFWTYLATSLPLMGLTLACTLFLDRRSRRRAVLGKVVAADDGVVLGPGAGPAYTGVLPSHP
ncbi:hypothetical protein LTR91_015579 [Friedmanniomyces endolithicus]|uniref:CorA-like transporter domain-containing protein n=1 Tax=Friedmanniomyces endolithicus TaxID=329885 RepID=A0AAN6K9J6_9PEZI|nr:hypothetical protein LTR59_011904 [Friedmanniomyces endolithicus]KAK0788967.1 hypothetical protein LTR38_011115 [Friedmanniomyces endolithicus]KAK0795288.1 hypothetical protein LTR75_010528 [Friedmanniomyces endolithicus]KAK0850498.1 hypothetical protein LTS02_013180 [Friedmanniomyces endolithicus]KAK0857117.1 hypothetical protein LTR03_001039 [Friedmanniomyces endolithicus]